MNLDGYTTNEVIHESSRSRVYRGKRTSDNQPVILKVLASAYPTPEEIERFQREFEIMSRFQNEGVVRAYEVKEKDSRQVMVLEDFHGVSLKRVLEGGAFSLDTFFPLAISVANILEKIHEQQIIHKDINDSNIIWNVGADQIKIIDFGISTELRPGVPGVDSINGLEGTLSFISPEQTGRMNRPLDYRSDYYSLGVTFYKLLSGKLPFDSEDSMEIVHSHMAREPAPLHQLVPGFPVMVSEIVLKLMKKNAEDRYQSVQGLTADLELCREEFLRTGNIELFALGLSDVRERFQIPQDIFGRGDETESLLDSFERVNLGARELFLVSGPAGIGKSSLVNELQREVAESKGRFIQGRFEEFKKDVPYFAVIQAFTELVSHLLRDDESEVQGWKTLLEEALGEQGRIITDVIPDVELIIGSQPTVEALGPQESLNRFNAVFQRFIKVFAAEGRPLILFLDDLHQADPASLQLLKNVLTDPDMNYLLLIGAFRDDKSTLAHSLSLLPEQLTGLGVRAVHKELMPLSSDVILEILSATLRGRGEDIKALAGTVFDKTGGNPFFVNEFLQALHQSKNLKFDRAGGQWTWDLKEIEALQVTDNVVSLMAEKIARLPVRTLEALKSAAVVGTSVDLKLLSQALELGRPELLSILQGAVNEGLLVPSRGVLHFVHDRVREAAYSLLSEEDRGTLHIKVGRKLLANCSEEEQARQIFDIVNHFNQALSILDDSEKLTLARLNLRAGRKALDSAAFQAAFHYLNLGHSLLGPEVWTLDYDLALEFYDTGAQAACQSAEYETMEIFVDAVLDNARDILDRTNVYAARMLSLQTRLKPEESVRLALDVMAQLGMKLPRNPGLPRIVFELLRVKLAIGRRSVEELKELPESTETEKVKALIQITSGSGSAIYFTRPLLMPVLVLRMLSKALTWGMDPDMAMSFVAYGLILVGELGDVDKGMEFGRAAMELLERHKVRRLFPRVHLIYYHMMLHWKEHVRETLQPLMNTHNMALEYGDFEFGAYAAIGFIHHSLFLGDDPAKLEEKGLKFIEVLRNLKQEISLPMLQICLQTLMNLQGKAENPGKMKGEAYDQDTMLPLQLEARDRTGLGYLHANRMYLEYLFEDYAAALQTAEDGRKYMTNVTGQLNVSMFFYYELLSALALYADVGFLKKRKLMKRIHKNHKKLKLWAKNAPVNYAHKEILVQAELARIQGRDNASMKLYEQAAEGARSHGYRNDEALAWELAGRYWMHKAMPKIARTYLSRAAYAYRLWGASAKVDALIAKYGEEMLSQSAGGDFTVDGDSTVTTTYNSSTRTTGSGTNRLDLITVVKASQAIAGEIVFENFLRKMLKIVVENAGGRRGFFILESDKHLYLEARYEVSSKAESIDSIEAEVFSESLPLKGFSELSEAIVRYVSRTGKSVVLNNAAGEGDYTTDPYVSREKPKSLLCVPIINRGHISGILYMENNLNTGVFTEQRLEVLNMLSSQIAVSVDNSRLYKGLEERVQERTRQLQETLEQVQELKTHQDGDYFLTSLLIKPLSRNEATSSRVDVQFLVKQYKKFNFKDWKEEIGGDMCVAHTLALCGRSHTVFLNVDAMGKSMQGAGGALVLGAVFRSIIERTRTSPELMGQNAAAWLKATLLELQNVFVSFDGSMLLSLVMGVMDEDKGILHFVNAEHPFTVLFRKGRARFLEKELTLRKLGIPDVFHKIAIHKVRLQPGDVVICGSDGRDDILMSRDALGNRVLNEDENQFLRRVEEGDGQLDGIHERLLAQGELTDDVSLIRLEYK